MTFIKNKMTKGIYLHIGLNYVDSNHYFGWGGKLSGDYSSFYKQTMDILSNHQTPNYFDIGSSNDNFNNQKTFSI